MGFKKHRHSKDKLYIRAVEWEQEFGGYKKTQSLRSGVLLDKNQGLIYLHSLVLKRTSKDCKGVNVWFSNLSFDLEPDCN